MNMGTPWMAMSPDLEKMNKGQITDPHNGISDKLLIHIME